MQSLPSIHSGSGDSAVVFQLQSIEAQGLTVFFEGLSEELEGDQQHVCCVSMRCHWPVLST